MTERPACPVCGCHVERPLMHLHRIDCETGETADLGPLCSECADEDGLRERHPEWVRKQLEEQ